MTKTQLAATAVFGFLLLIVSALHLGILWGLAIFAAAGLPMLFVWLAVSSGTPPVPLPDATELEPTN